MANLSTLFALRDEVSSKLKNIHGNFKKVDDASKSVSDTLQKMNGQKTKIKVDFDDNISDNLSRVKKNLQSFSKNDYEASLGLEDKAFNKTMDGINKKLNGFANESFNAILDVTDN